MHYSPWKVPCLLRCSDTAERVTATSDILAGKPSRVTNLQVMLCPDGGVLYGLYLHCVDQKLFTPHHAQNVPCTLIMAAEGRAAVVTTDAIAPRVGSGRGYKDFWGLGVQPGWDSEAWAQRGLLQEDGTVCVNISLGLPSSA